MRFAEPVLRTMPLPAASWSAAPASTVTRTIAAGGARHKPASGRAAPRASVDGVAAGPVTVPAARARRRYRRSCVHRTTLGMRRAPVTAPVPAGAADAARMGAAVSGREHTARAARSAALAGVRGFTPTTSSAHRRDRRNLARRRQENAAASRPASVVQGKERVVRSVSSVAPDRWRHPALLHLGALAAGDPVAGGLSASWRTQSRA